MKKSGQNTSVMTIQEWVLTLIVSLIPIIGFIMLFIWGFSNNSNANKANFAKSALIVWAILITFYFSFFLIFGVALLRAMNNY